MIIHRFRTVNCPDVFDRSPVLILRGAAALHVLFIRQARGAYVGRHITLILCQRAAQAFAVNQLVIQITRHQAGDGFAHVILIGLVAEYPQVKRLLELLRQRGPVGANRLQPFEHHPLRVTFLNQPGVALLAALVGTANGGH